MAAGGEQESFRGEVRETRVLGQEYWGRSNVLATDGRTVSMVGKILGFRVGDTIEAHGRWDHHPRYGAQFRADEVIVVAPQDASGVISWLAAYIPNFGRKRAAELVERYGVPGIWQVIEHTPNKLLEVKGITEGRVAEITAAYREHRQLRDRMVRFRIWGLTDGQTARVLAAWGDKAEEHLTSDPYQLVELDGIGFLTADGIALRMGVGRETPERIRAAGAFVLEEDARSGNVYTPTPKLVKMTAALLQLAPEEVRPHLRDLPGTVRRNAFVYLRRYDVAEHQVAMAFARMVAPGPVKATARAAGAAEGKAA